MEGKLGYRLRERTTGKLIASRDVLFDEETLFKHMNAPSFL